MELLVSQLQSAVASLEDEVRRRKSAEEHLADLEQGLAATLAGIGAGFITTDALGRVKRMNAVAERVTGWSQAEARGHILWEVCAREGRPAEVEQSNPVQLLLDQHVEEDTIRQLIGVSRDGTRTALEVKVTLRRGEDGQPLGVALVMRDMTQLSRAEAELRRLAAIVESCNDAIVGTTLDGRITNWNRAAEALFGYSAAEAVDRPVQMLIPPERVAQERHILVDLAQGRGVQAFDTVRQAQDGRRIEVSVSISPIRDPFGRLIGASTVARDITEHKRRDAELLRSNAELEQFAYVASHDMQEPLRMVVNYAELVAQRYQGQLDAKADKYLHYAVEGARRMQRLVTDLLDYSRVGSQGKPLVPVSADAVLKSVLRSLHPLIQERQARIEHAALPTVLADETQLRQLFQNLIANAIKFHGDAPPRVVVAARLQDERWHFSVSDNGIGMDMKHAEHIFQMFQRLHERSRYEGSGIGLAIAKRIVERHGGTIRVESAPGVGSTFWFTLPPHHGRLP